MQTLVASILVFGLLVLAHELGHFCLSGDQGEGVGAGPRFWSRLAGWKRGIPATLRSSPGGSADVGEDPEQEEVPSEDSFIRKSILQRALILIAGPLMNLVLALLLFFVIFYFMLGTPLTGSSFLGEIVDDSPASRAGLRPGDEIVAIDGRRIDNWDEVVAQIENRAGEKVTIDLLRQGEQLTVTAVPELTPGAGKAIIGISPPVKRFHFVESVKVSFSRFALILTTIGRTITGRAPLDVTGPVGVIMIVGEAAATGFVNLVWLAGLISISLGIINLLPIPALDGGRLLFLVVEGLRGKPLDPEKEGLIHFIGFAALLLLILFVTYHDR